MLTSQQRCDGEDGGLHGGGMVGGGLLLLDHCLTWWGLCRGLRTESEHSLGLT